MFAITTDWMSFLIIGFATLFLIGELLVNVKGIFSIIGFGFLTVYFASSLDPGMFFLMVALYMMGLGLVLIDGKIINDGTLAVIGLVIMIISVGFTAPSWSSGLYAVLGVFIGGFLSFGFLKVFPKRRMWSKIPLSDQLTEEKGYSTMNQSYYHLIGKQGYTITDMRPIGTIRIDESEYSAITEGKWLKRDTPIQVADVDGTRILVKDIRERTKKA
ncbi:hypothetical protein J416_05723 [Gracilibacillus halophilus YIM-C55.5]|uniref:NfeD-like C-terminal domain-containing protein n=1 Tax=Gracilibacillus halophilus YIM-C55.5 TaxID=1308866 RepID=N4WT09_9BACI|nr:NfeD family protein [Gracilibacillus halophilus]ENH97485.1 hypothetical protein J416_05723 [Gracilibacillus halophilus YIM-C55.5]